MGGVSLTHPVLDLFLMWGVSLTHPELTSLLCGEFLCWLLSSAIYSEDNLLRKELGGSWPRRKVWKSHTEKPKKEALEQPEQSRTKPEKNWVKSGHRNERGRKEMGLSSKQALAGKKQRSEWIRALQMTQKTTTLKTKELGRRWPR